MLFNFYIMVMTSLHKLKTNEDKLSYIVSEL